MIGSFFSYLRKDAYKCGDPDKGRGSYETATGYASSVKIYYTTKFRNSGPELNVFGTTKWRELQNRLLSQFKEETKSTGTALVNGHEASEDSDRNAIAIGCYWLGTVEAAEFLHLNNTMMQCSGRGTEVSLLTKSSIRASDVNELCYSYNILKIDLTRQKDGPRQSISIFPHCDSCTRTCTFPSCISSQWTQPTTCRSISYPSLLPKPCVPIPKARSTARFRHYGQPVLTICSRNSKLLGSR